MPQKTVGDISMYFEEAGAGPPLVFIHGLGACAEDWEFQIPEFSKTHRVIALDLRGFGRTPRGSGPLSVPRMAADVKALLDALGIVQPVLIGHSMGGAVCLQLALDHPGTVQKMVISNSVPTFKPRTLRQRFEIFYRLVVTRLIGPRLIAEIGARRMYPLPAQAELRKKVIARGRYNTGANYSAALSVLTRWSVIERLDELKMRVLVCASEHDYFSREDAISFAWALPRGRFHMFKTMHHGLPLEAPDAFNTVMRDFLDYE